MRNYYFLKPRLSLESSAMNHQVATRGQLCIAFGHHFVGTGVLWKVSEEGELPWWLSGKEPTCNAGDPGSIPGWGRSPGGGHGNPLQYSFLENPMDRGPWRAAVHRVAELERLKQLSSAQEN